MFEVGDSFVLKNSYGRHLHVIVAEASGDKDDQVMLVYLTSAKNFRDNTTIIKHGEHPFVTKQSEISWIKYQSIQIVPRNQIKNELVVKYGKINDALLKRIQDGIEKSDFASKEHKRLFHQWKMDRLFRNPYF
jgi:uncharacterized protein YifN (PemK superfamily)